jgi:hypothetical protein
VGVSKHFNAGERGNCYLPGGLSGPQNQSGYSWGGRGSKAPDESNFRVKALNSKIVASDFIKTMSNNASDDTCSSEGIF